MGLKNKKIRRLISEGQKETDAEVLVDTVDRERAAFVKNYFHADWPNRAVYHAMLHTAAGEEAAGEAMLSVLKQANAAVPNTGQPGAASSSGRAARKDRPVRPQVSL